MHVYSGNTFLPLKEDNLSIMNNVTRPNVCCLEIPLYVYITVVCLLAVSLVSCRLACDHRQCAEFLSLAVSSWERPVVEKAANLVEELLRKGLLDADSTARKHCRRYMYIYTHSA